jgi:hypothetical protein
VRYRGWCRRWRCLGFWGYAESEFQSQLWRQCLCVCVFVFVWHFCKTFRHTYVSERQLGSIQILLFLLSVSQKAVIWTLISCWFQRRQVSVWRILSKPNKDNQTRENHVKFLENRMNVVKLCYFILKHILSSNADICITICMWDSQPQWDCEIEVVVWFC